MSIHPPINFVSSSLNKNANISQRSSSPLRFINLSHISYIRIDSSRSLAPISSFLPLHFFLILFILFPLGLPLSLAGRIHSTHSNSPIICWEEVVKISTRGRYPLLFRLFCFLRKFVAPITSSFLVPNLSLSCNGWAIGRFFVSAIHSIAFLSFSTTNAQPHSDSSRSKEREIWGIEESIFSRLLELLRENGLHLRHFTRCEDPLRISSCQHFYRVVERERQFPIQVLFLEPSFFLVSFLASTLQITHLNIFYV